MAVVYKILGQANPPANTPNALYSVPSGNTAVVSSVVVCNTDNTPRSFRVAVRPNGAALANIHYIAYNTFLPSLDTITMTVGMTLGANDLVSVEANTTGVSFSLFGSEIR